MASGRGRGGIRGWRDWLRRARRHTVAAPSHPAPEDARRPVPAPVQSPSEDADGAPSLDQVLRRATEAREAARHDPKA